MVIIPVVLPASPPLWDARSWEVVVPKAISNRPVERNIIRSGRTTEARISTQAAATTIRGLASTLIMAASGRSARATSTPPETAEAATTAALGVGTIILTTSILFRTINKAHHNKIIPTTQGIPSFMDPTTISLTCVGTARPPATKGTPSRPPSTK